MTIVASNSLTVSNVNDGTTTHIAYANSADGTDGFTTVYPNLNLLDGTKDFSGADWINISSVPNDGTFKGLTIKSKSSQWNGLYKNYTIPEDGDYVFSVYTSASADGVNPAMTISKNNTVTKNTVLSTTMFDMQRFDYVYKNLKKGDVVSGRIDKSGTATGKVSVAGHKWEKSSTATPWMPSSSEVTTADWPSYIGQYSDFTFTASTDSAKYAPWTIFKGDDGTGIKTTTITYAGSTSGTTAPTSSWTSTVPTVAAGSYLWTKTVWTYTDNTSETGYSVAKMGNTGPTGPAGPPGSNGDPGKIVSDTEPTTRFKGLTWKYLGTSDLTASDGTVIKPNTEYYYNGTHWVINYFSVNNFAAESITSDKIDGKNLTITDGEFVSTTTNGPVITSTEIKDNHIAISKTDGTVNTRNDIALDSEQGLAQKFTNINTGFYRTAGINYQGPFTSDSDGNYAQLTPQGTKLSTDVPWTTLSPMGGFSGGLIRFAVKNGVAHFSLAGLSCPPMTAGNWIKCAQLPSGSIAIPSENQVTAAFTNATVWGFYVSKSGGLYLQSTSNSPALNGFVNASNSYPIG